MSETEIEVTPVVLELDVTSPATLELEVAPVALDLEIAPVVTELEVASVETVVEVSPTGPPGAPGPSGSSKPLITRSISSDLTIAGGDTCLQQEAQIESGVRVTIEPGGRMLLL